MMEDNYGIHCLKCTISSILKKLCNFQKSRSFLENVGYVHRVCSIDWQNNKSLSRHITTACDTTVVTQQSWTEYTSRHALGLIGDVWIQCIIKKMILISDYAYICMRHNPCHILPFITGTHIQFHHIKEYWRLVRINKHYIKFSGLCACYVLCWTIVWRK